MGEGDKKVTFQPGAAFQMTILLDLCIDGTASSGTAKMDFTMTGSGTAKADGQEFQLMLDARGTQKENHEDLKK